MINTINTTLHANITAQLELLSSPFITGSFPLQQRKAYIINQLLPELAKYPLEACTKQGCRRTIDNDYLSHDNGWKPFTAGVIEMVDSSAELIAIIEMRKADLLTILELFPLLSTGEPMFTPVQEATQDEPNDVFWINFDDMLKRLRALKGNYNLNHVAAGEVSLTKTCCGIAKDAMATITPKMYILSEPTEFERDVTSIVGEDVSQYIHDLYTGSVPAIRANHWLNSPNAELYAGYLRSFTIETIAGLHNDIHKVIPDEPEQFSIGTFTLLITLIPRNKLEAAFNHASTLTSHAELMDYKEWLRGLTPTIK